MFCFGLCFCLETATPPHVIVVAARTAEMFTRCAVADLATSAPPPWPQQRKQQNGHGRGATGVAGACAGTWPITLHSQKHCSWA